MASSQPDPIEREERQPSSHGGGSHHQPQIPAPATGYPPTTGYPAYQYYNYNPNYNYRSPQQVHKQQRIYCLCRGIIGGLIFFILFGCIISIVTWLILQPLIPIFHVNNLTVSDFNTSSSSLTANWIANVSARNPNEKLEIDFDEIDVYMIYNDEYIVASATSKPFPMKTKENATMVVTISAAKNGSEMGDLKERDMEKMVTEKKSSRKVGFELRMMVWGTFKSGNWWARHVLFKVFCENLQIGFLNKNSTNGTLINANSLLNCLVTA